MKKYKLVVCGGTFDHFHRGHEAFLNYALSLSEKIIVGLTSDEYLKNSKFRVQNSEFIESFEIRKLSLLSFLQKEEVLDRVEIEPIDDIFIPKVWEDLPIEAIVVSRNTVWGAEKINSKRKEQRKYPLEIETVPLIKNDNNEYISSSRIRSGETNRDGKPYVNPLWLKKTLLLPESLREELKKPFGVLLRNDVILANEARCQTVPSEVRPESPTVVRDAGQASMTHPYAITVGDVTTKKFNDLNLNHKISVIDFKVGRKKMFSKIQDVGFLDSIFEIRVKNPAGTLTPDLFKACQKAWGVNQKIVILVEGEEDLAVLPLILTAPLAAVIFYGQPNEGLVKVEVSEESKSRAYELVGRFSCV